MKASGKEEAHVEIRMFRRSNETVLNVDAKGLQHVSSARLRGSRAVTVLEHRHATGRDNNHGHRGDVDGICAITTGADDIDCTALNNTGELWIMNWAGK